MLLLFIIAQSLLGNPAHAYYPTAEQNYRFSETTGCPAHGRFYTYDHRDAYCELESPETAIGVANPPNSRARNDYRSGQSCLPFPSRGRTGGLSHTDAFALDTLIRGAPPSVAPLGASGIDCLIGSQVGLVVDLREHEEGTAHEEAAILSRGIAYANFPMNTDLQASDSAVSMNARAALAALKEIRDFKKNHPGVRIYIHCAHGADRTGLIVGLYRRFLEGVSAADARSEMIQNGYGGQAALQAVWDHPESVAEGLR